MIIERITTMEPVTFYAFIIASLIVLAFILYCVYRVKVHITKMFNKYNWIKYKGINNTEYESEVTLNE
jgi:cell division protein FtsL